MALQPPLDQAVQPIIQAFTGLTDNLDNIQDKILEYVNNLQEKLINLPDKIDCNDPRISEMKDLLSSINDRISDTQRLTENIQTVINILLVIATAAAVAIAIAIVITLVGNPAIEQGLKTAAFVVATILGILGLISLNLDSIVSLIQSLPDTLNNVLDKISSTCNNQAINLNTLKNLNDSDSQIDISQFEDMTESEFYQLINVSESDIQGRENKIEQLLEQQKSLLDNLIEAPSNVLVNTGVPDNNLGKTGDYYINKQNNQIYGPKVSDTSWGSPLN